MTTLSVRIDKEIEDKLNLLLKLRKINDKSAYIRKLLSRSLQEDLIDDYCIQIQKGKISLWKGAEMLGLSLREMMNETRKRKITIYDEEALEIDLKFVYNE